MTERQESKLNPRGYEMPTMTMAEYEAEQREQKRQAQLIRTDPQACATKLWKIACSDTGGSRCASGILLSLWNSSFRCDLQDSLSGLDIGNTEAALGLLEHMAYGKRLHEFLTEDQIKVVIEAWGDFHTFRRGNQ
ncbi:MAG: hypothetical protein R3180_00070 [Marinobacter sp.]|nr:hypothetical protein [Marinobacter sp.]